MSCVDYYLPAHLHAAVGEHTLLHGEALLVLATHDLEDVALELLRSRVEQSRAAAAGRAAVSWLAGGWCCGGVKMAAALQKWVPKPVMAQANVVRLHFCSADAAPFATASTAGVLLSKSAPPRPRRSPRLVPLPG
jgi:hypothetical protein